MSLHGGSATISKLARMIMRDGKLHLSLRIIDDCVQHLRVGHGIQHPAAFMERAIEKAKPVVELRKYKVSGRALQIPASCRPARQTSLAVRFVRYVERGRARNARNARARAESGQRVGDVFY